MHIRSTNAICVSKEVVSAPAKLLCVGSADGAASSSRASHHNVIFGRLHLRRFLKASRKADSSGLVRTESRVSNPEVVFCGCTTGRMA